ncbi:penicillin-binding transpeptidase domain-containing protein [Nakamurella antarctica]|nr:penicillin-binding transpeptidase domain-containing protein [Nakamurella antarctica]
MSKNRRPRSQLLLLPLLLVVSIVVSACTAAPAIEPPPAPTAEIAAYAQQWQSGNHIAASVLTTEPAVAQQALDRVEADLQASSLTVLPGAITRVNDNSATVPVDISWSLGDAGTWAYQVQWKWSRQDGAWKLAWDSTSINPDLGPQQGLVVRITKATDGSLVDRDNNQVLSPVRVYSVVAIQAKMTRVPEAASALVSVLGQFDSTLNADEIAAQIAAADPSTGYTVLNLREESYATVADQLAAIPGISAPSSIRNLPVTKDFAKSLLGQVTPIADALTKGVKGWRIVTVDSTGAELKTLSEQQAVPGAKVTLTLDTKVQSAAEGALAKIPEPAVIVAIQPSTGEILAVAQNAPANALGTIALSGQYPPGSIFKIITATAGIDGSSLRADTEVACPGEWVVDSRPIKNSHSFDLGTVALKTAFAKSCNTSFAQIATALPPSALNSTAKEFGVGLDFDMKGAITLTGQVPVAQSIVQQAEDGFGQG